MMRIAACNASTVRGQRAEPEQRVRVHLTRQTDYGDRFRLLTLKAPAEAGGPAAFGLRLMPLEEGGGYEVIDLVGFQGLAEQAGATWGDIVTAVEVARPGQPPKEWIYLIGLLLIALVLALQWRPFQQWRQDQAAREAAA